jgi:outer membrane protein OmpA-like peptidoglycan-associated protein
MTVAAVGAREEPVVMTEEEVQALVGPALEALPKPPEHLTFYFVHDSTELTEASRAKLPEVLQIIRKRAAVEISVVGHSDTVGTSPYNYRLSLERARAVATLLVAKGVNPSVLEMASHGEHDPLIPTGDETPEPRNRRVEAAVR